MGVVTQRAQPAIRRRGPGIRHRTISWALRHLQVFFYTLGQLTRSPFGSAMTASVIGIALALPAGLYVLLENAQSMSSGWEGTAQISLFLHSKVSDGRAAELAGQMASLPEVSTARVITRAEALAEFQEMSGFGAALEALEANPLPSVIVVQPAVAHSDAEAVKGLVAKFATQAEVDIAQFDLQWVKRLYALMEIVQRGVLVLAALLSVAVLLIVGNTIRLDIENRREEIEIAKLVGATNAFIRRPFLYAGFWYGLFGGLLAYALVSSALELLREPTRQLALLYYSDFALLGLEGTASMVLVGSGALLGLGGSWVAVGRHLSSIEPS
ncbi:MAG: permease-like cell division protein FtsX [Gammaproteobacteria bacterium]|nr:permease-like cell division protein FtsX [Gammaproteobacteria bacterium]